MRSQPTVGSEVEQLSDGRWCARVSFTTPDEARAHHALARYARADATTGIKADPTHGSWQAMLIRCRYPRTNGHHNYGGRGIRVCDRWDPALGGSFANFLVDMGVRPEGTTLDRVDVDGNYEPGNCRWATRLEQRRNRRNYGHKLTLDEVRAIRASTLSNAETGRQFGIDGSCVSRIRARKSWAHLD